MINVVSFYAPRPEHPRFCDYLPMLRLLEASCRRYGHRHIVLSDTALDGFEVFRCDLPRELMPATIEAQLQYLKAHNTPTLLTGADCVLGMDPEAVFERTFDIAMTTDHFPGFCLNTGAMFIRDCPLAAAFWQQARSICGSSWGDDQLCLEQVFHAKPDPCAYVMPDGQVIECLPMKGYHYAPPRLGKHEDAVVIHFRGRRKAFMADYCAQHLGLRVA